MRSTVKHLAQEHGEIRQVLSSFASFMDEVSADSAPDRQELWTLIDCLTESLLIRHEEKEETILLPELFRLGMSWNDGPLDTIRQEHRHSRYLMCSLRQAVHQAREWGTDGRRHFLSVGTEWIEFVLRHMAEEEKALFPILNEKLTDELDAQMTSQFEAIDADFEKMPGAKKLREGKDRFIERHPGSGQR